MNPKDPSIRAREIGSNALTVTSYFATKKRSQEVVGQAGSFSWVEVLRQGPGGDPLRASGEKRPGRSGSPRRSLGAFSFSAFQHGEVARC